jgi:hypothetical protein
LSEDAWEEGGSDAEGSDEGSASSLVAFDLQEDLAAEQWWGPDGLGPVDSKGLGLRALAAALRKQDDVDGALAALRKVRSVSCWWVGGVSCTQAGLAGTVLLLPGHSMRCTCKMQTFRQTEAHTYSPHFNLHCVFMNVCAG